MAKRPLSIPDRSLITEDTPLRLAVAAEVAFPQGGMTASGLRKERDAGRLVTELVAGREFTTLGDIARMREMCRGQTKRPLLSDAARLATDGPDDSKRARATAKLALERLKAVGDEKQKAEREARQKLSDAIRAERAGRPGVTVKRRRPSKA